MLLSILKAEASSEGGIHLPVDYRPGFMSIIKSAIQSEAEDQYELMFNKRSVKPYTFAVTFGDEIEIIKDEIFFTKPIEFKFSSFDFAYEVYIYNYLVKHRRLNIYQRSFEVSSIRVFDKHEIRKNSAIFRTFAPVLIRSHKNEKHYLCPECENFGGDEDFDEAFRFNINELARNLIGIDFVDVEFRPIKLKRVVVKHMTKYGDLKFPGFVGVFYLGAPIEVLNLVNKAGLGSRRSEGFGMVDLVREV
ncbi:MAG: CRISPR-associated endoribonuclease Cas6 [Candidatus Kryptonium sp.]